MSRQSKFDQVYIRELDQASADNLRRFVAIARTQRTAMLAILGGLDIQAFVDLLAQYQQRLAQEQGVKEV